MSDQVEREANINPNVAAAIVENQISEPKSSQGLFDLPCGYIDADGDLHTEVKVREITGYEEDILANKKVPANKKINELIARCVERVGRITDAGQLNEVTLDMTVGDRLFIIFAIRRVTVGDLYTYETKCPECKHIDRVTVDLDDLEIKKMDDPMRRTSSIVLPRSKKEVVIKTMTGRDEERLSTLMAKRAEDAMSLGLISRIVSIDGKPPTLSLVKGLSSADRGAIRAAFEESEGGVDTSIDLSCPNCYNEYQRDLDVGQAGFFFPTETPKS